MPQLKTLTEQDFQQYEAMYRHVSDVMIPELWAQYGVMPAEQWYEEMTTAQSICGVLRKVVANAIEEATQ